VVEDHFSCSGKFICSIWSVIQVASNLYLSRGIANIFLQLVGWNKSQVYTEEEIRFQMQLKDKTGV
jgi:hypothetical protein